MTQTLERMASDARIVSFQVDSFELVGDHLELRGRWFGVRGRRFVRPTLTFNGGSDSSRLLAELRHKPWNPEEGALWEAWFPCGSDGLTANGVELAVAPDIAVELPSPEGLPGGGHADPAPTGARPTQRRPKAEASRVEADALRAELQALRAENQGLKGETKTLLKARDEAVAGAGRGCGGA